MSVLITMFYRFHQSLVKENKTTIENLEHRNEIYVSRYDMSYEYNYNQVYGTNRFLDWFPIMPSSARPKGDGIYFDKNAESTDSEDEDDNTAEPEDPRNPAHPGALVPDHSGDTQSPPIQTTSAQQLERPGTQKNTGTITRQGDVMRIHDNRGNQIRNINDIIRSENMPQDFRSNESEENLRITGNPNTGQPHFTSKTIEDKKYEELKSEFYMPQNQTNQRSTGIRSGVGGRLQGN